MSSRPRSVTLASRHAVQLLPKAPSCGNQPAHISLTARRNDTLTRTGIQTKHEAPAPLTRDGRLTLPLDKQPHISVDDFDKIVEWLTTRLRG